MRPARIESRARFSHPPYAGWPVSNARFQGRRPDKRVFFLGIDIEQSHPRLGSSVALFQRPDLVPLKGVNTYALTLLLFACILPVLWMKGEELTIYRVWEEVSYDR